MREDPETAHSARFIFRFYRLVLLMCPLEERYIIVTKRKSYLLVCDISYVGHPLKILIELKLFFKRIGK